MRRIRVRMSGHMTRIRVRIEGGIDGACSRKGGCVATGVALVYSFLTYRLVFFFLV